MSGRQQVIKIGEYYYVEDYNAGTSLALNTNIQNARWFDSSIPALKNKMDTVCLNYGVVIVINIKSGELYERNPFTKKLAKQEVR